ncbi:MAG: hypothetical protein MJY57_04480 [Bacteroidales bacterium]|nr:hypothetical protein [Bacteroidales bacterium]
MKKILFCIFTAVLSVMTVSCKKELNTASEEQYFEILDRVPMTLTAGTESSRSILSGRDILWVESDSIAVFDGATTGDVTQDPATSAMAPFVLSEKASDSKSATFTGSAAVADTYWAVAPFHAAKKVTAVEGGEKISIKINSKQFVDADHQVDPFTLVATGTVTDGAVSFTNQFSLVKVTITRDDVVSVVLTGNNGEKIGGTNFLLTADGSMDLTNGATTAETLYYGERPESGAEIVPQKFVPGDYYIAIWPREFPNGFALTVQTNDGGIALKKTTKAASFTRNKGLDLGTVDTGLTFYHSPIMTAAELSAWADLNRAGVLGKNDTAELGADIDLADLGEGYKWATLASLYGHLDGKGHNIKNLIVDNALTRTGFIGTLEENASITNVIFGAASSDASSITLTQSDPGNWCYGGIIGYIQKGASVTDVTTYVPVTVAASCDGKHSAGGIAGNMKANTTVEGCVNWAPVTDNSSYASTSADSCIGGIVGMSDSAGSIVKDCINEGEASGQITNYCTGNPNLGGIVGRLSGSGTVEGCTNNGYVVNEAGSEYSSDSFKVFVGGIVGVVTGSSAKIIKCVNEQRELANVSLSTRLGLGGIVGGATGSGLQILGCKNNTGAMNIGFSNSKDVAIGGIIGQSNNTIRISKADDGTWTENCKGYTQNKNFGGTTYIGGIAGMLDKASTENIVEYCQTAATARCELNDKQTTSGKTANVGGICGATKGVITNCTNNMHIYCRKSSNGYPRIYYGGICGSYSDSRYPLEISYCTNNGNVGAYNPSKGEPCFGGILCCLYPEKTVVKFCTNTGAMTTGQAKTDGTISSIQDHSGFDMGGLCGDIAQTSGSDPVTIFEGCVVDCKVIARKNTNYKYYGLICGWPSGTKSETGHPQVTVGTVENPLVIVKSSKVETGTDAAPTVESVIAQASSYDDIKLYLFGPWLYSTWVDGSAGKGNFTSIDGADFEARYKLNLRFDD